VVVIGGGFLGSELAVAMGDAARKSENKFTVEQIIKEEGNLGFILPDYLSRWTKGKVEECGVSVTSNARVTNATQCSETGKIRLELSNDTCVECDHVVAAVGLEIDQDFATKSGLEWDDKRGGMVVNSELQAKANVWIAGDATSFHDPKLGRRRVEHHDHAVVTGRLAGTNMSSEDAFSYYHQSMYWSDLGPEVGFEAIGLTDCKSLKTLGCFKKATSADTPKAREEIADGEKIEAVETKDYGKGVVFYLNKVDRVVGVVSWNLFGKMKRARKLISDGITVQSEEDLDELAKLFFPKKKAKKAKKVEEVKPVEAEIKVAEIVQTEALQAVVVSDPVIAEPVVVEPVVAEPVVVEPVVVEPVVVAEPVIVAEPVAIAEPVVLEPVVIEPVVVDPVVVEPVVVEPVVVEPVVVEPVIIVEPVVIAPEPVVIAEPVVISEPVVIAEPVVIEPVVVEPVVVEPVVVEPVIITEPVVIAAEPVVIAEPVVVEPVIIAEPVVITAEPVIISEPVVISEPVIIPEPVSEPVSATVIISEPVSVPEPIISEPVTISEPILASEQPTQPISISETVAPSMVETETPKE